MYMFTLLNVCVFGYIQSNLLLQYILQNMFF